LAEADKALDEMSRQGAEGPDPDEEERESQLGSRHRPEPFWFNDFD